MTSIDPGELQAVRAVITSEQELHFETVRFPSQPEGHKILCKTERSIISAGTELANYTGLDADTRRPGKWCTYPWAPGYGGIGRVVALGPAVKRFQPGDRVYSRFHHSNYEQLDSENEFCVRVPDSLDSTTASFARMGNVAISAYQRSHVGLNDGVVVIGLGLVGNLAGQFYRIGGQRVSGLDLAAHRRSLAKETGFHSALDPAAYATTESLLEAVQAANHGVSPRVVVDAVGDSRLIELGLKLCAFNGQVIMLGTPRAPYETNCTPILDMAHRAGISIVGALEWRIPLLKRSSSTVSTEGNGEMILRLIESGELHVKPLLSHVVAPAELNSAYQGLLHRKDEYLGVVVDWENYPAPEADYARTG